MSNNTAFADMHIHSNQSDGVLSPEEIIRIARKIPNLKAISITDHDNAQGSKTALNYNQNSVEIIPGIEFSCEKNDEEVHILGYFIDVYNHILMQTEQKLLGIREERAEKFVRKLNNNGVGITLDDVYKYSKGKAVGRPHIASAILHKGYTQSVEEAYNKYLLKGSPTYVPRAKMTVEEAMHIISACGGVSVIAHPSSVKNQHTITQIIDMGIQGIEAYHPMNSEENTAAYIEAAKQKGLYITGGSDFHSSDRADRVSIGQCGVDYCQIEEIKKYLNFK